MAGLTLIRTDASNADFKKLVASLDEDLRLRDGKEHVFYNQFNKTDTIKEVIVAYSHNLPVGCGAFKKYESHTAEVKRMFVHPDYRKQGIASQVLSALENWATELNYTACLLETGKKQPEAIALYNKAGYFVIPNYGQYAGVENSVCMRKKLADNTDKDR